MISKPDKQEIRPWKEEGGRRRANHAGSIPPKTSISARLSAKPKVSGQEYMNMYILEKQKERTEKYGDTLYKRQLSLKKEWEEINEALAKVDEELHGGPRKPGRKSRREKPEKSSKNMKKINWDY